MYNKETVLLRQPLVINNVKCKIISRAFAVVARNQPFINICKFAS